MPNRPARPKSPPLAPLTGLDVAMDCGAQVVIGASGDDCCYAWQTRVIVLSPEVARGTDLLSLLIAAEEVAHHEQPRWVHRFRFLHPLRWYAEANAFVRVKAWLREWSTPSA